ncbi:hypothetical protein K445DRAFT_378279 [Daldinia sp. EC12]|nr:hypothetical protein K445DRAFT_378279 [Daldinia sp. EC12]
MRLATSIYYLTAVREIKCSDKGMSSFLEDMANSTKTKQLDELGSRYDVVMLQWLKSRLNGSSGPIAVPKMTGIVLPNALFVIPPLIVIWGNAQTISHKIYHY